MSAEAMEAFRARVAEDEGLQEAMQEALGTSVVDAVPADALVAFAAAHGFKVAAGDVAEGDEADDAELEGVVGGAGFLDVPGPELTPEEKKKLEEQWKDVPRTSGPSVPGGTRSG